MVEAIMPGKIPLWLDCDPGHDDATAILLAIHLDNINLLGVSTVHGNTTVHWTVTNAARCLHAFGAPAHIQVYPGAEKPLSRDAPKHCPEIHGEDGLAGVVGLPSPDSSEVQARFACDADGKRMSALQGMTKAVKEVWNAGRGRKVTIVSTGPMTNIAIFISAHPELLDGVEQFVFMGGANGFGNIAPAAAEAAQIVVNNPVKTIMLPLDVTHTAIVHHGIHARLCATHQHEHDLLNSPPTKLREMLSSLVTFFAKAYREVFDFQDGPPLHDALTIAYVSNPDLFKGRRLHVDVETRGEHTTGATIVHTFTYRPYDDTWGSNGKNCVVLESLEVETFFDILLDCIDRCDKVSPLNTQ
ncbi:Inosine/uridine-preferring nucleoside hydrolase domain-containing protein [Chiua virens]|nr:Inosine/uridine-preferring nucleoside hydrolase domain-containing protein [Chiua virens]